MDSLKIFFFLVCLYIFLDTEDMLLILIILILAPFFVIALITEGISMIWTKK